MDNYNLFNEYRCKVHILTKDGNVFHTTGTLYGVCYRFAVVRLWCTNDLIYHLIDRQTGLVAYRCKSLATIDRWFFLHKNQIFKMFGCAKYKEFSQRWQKIADRRRFNVWEKIY